MKQADDIVIDTLKMFWQERLPEFDGGDGINAKYKRCFRREPHDGGPRSPIGKKIARASRHASGGAITSFMGCRLWEFLFSLYKLKAGDDLSCQRNMLFKFDGKALRAPRSKHRRRHLSIRFEGKATRAGV